MTTRALRARVKYSERAVLFQNPRKLIASLGNPHLTHFVEVVDDVAFSHLRISSGTHDRSFLNFLYKALAFGRCLPMIFRAIIEKIITKWLSYIRLSKRVCSVSLAC